MTLEIIVGPMFSGKTTELIRLVEREAFAGKKAAIFKAATDRRSGRDEVATHSGRRYEAVSVGADSSGLLEIRERVESKGLEVVGVDEVNLFPDGIVELLDGLAGRLKAIAAGLNLDFRGEPFMTTATLSAKADRVTYLSAVCTKCGQEASRSQRFVGGRLAPRDSPLIVIGGEEMYEPRCRACFVVPV